MDRITAVLFSSDLVATSLFYARLGFHEKFREDMWMILERGTLELEFCPREGLDPCKNYASCCVRVSDANALHREFSTAGLSATGRSIPRMTAPKVQPWGLWEFVIYDPDGNLLRCLSEIISEADKHDKQN